MKKILFFLPALIFALSTTAQKVKKKREFTELTYELKKEYPGFEKAMRGAQYSNGHAVITLAKEDTQKTASLGRKGRMLLKDADVIKIRVWRNAICRGISKDGNSLRISYERNNSSIYLNYNLDLTDSTYRLSGEQVKYGKGLYTVVTGAGSSLYIKKKHYATLRKPKGKKIRF